MDKTVITIFHSIDVILGLYVTRSELLGEMDELFRYLIPSYDIPPVLINEEFQVNQNSILDLIDKFGERPQKKVRVIYFGNETCENLIPSVLEVEKAYIFCRNKNYQFSYVTPYTGPFGLEKIIRNLDALENAADQKNKIEVIFNDFGVLNVLERYKKFTPVLGRLLVKTKRDPRFLNTDFLRHVENITRPGKVIKNQTEAISKGSLEIKDYQEFLKKSGVKRVSMDIYRGISSIGKTDFPTDVYWPWTYVTSGRACQIAALNNPLLKNHPVNRTCRSECRRYKYVLKHVNNATALHRGNAVWMDSTNLIGEVGRSFSRLIYQPYIPI